MEQTAESSIPLFSDHLIIPVMVLTTSKSEEDIFRSDDLGVSGVIVNPVTLEGLVRAMNTRWQLG